MAIRSIDNKALVSVTHPAGILNYLETTCIEGRVGKPSSRFKEKSPFNEQVLVEKIGYLDDDSRDYLESLGYLISDYDIKNDFKS